jgi:CRISPR-associated protein Csm4
MNRYRVPIHPRTPFGTPLTGDTLFGQACWALREQFGEARLEELLDGYCDGRPFMIVSDGFPRGFLCRPTIPLSKLAGEQAHVAHARKGLRRVRWMPLSSAHLPLADWFQKAVQDLECGTVPEVVEALIVQNTIDRMTGTTGTGEFAPRQVERWMYPPGAVLDLHVLIDESRLALKDVMAMLRAIGLAGYGRDASSGSGKFEPGIAEPFAPADGGTAVMTLAPSLPPSGQISPGDSWYQPLTRFGRHGNVAARQSGFFKSPVMMMQTGAVLKPSGTLSVQWVGQGIGGRDRPVSAVHPAAVYQGYAPVVPVSMGDAR